MNHLDQQTNPMPEHLPTYLISGMKVGNKYIFLSFIFHLFCLPTVSFLFEILFSTSSLILLVITTFILNIILYHYFDYYQTKTHIDRDYLPNQMYPLLLKYQLYLNFKKPMFRYLTILVYCFCAWLFFVLIFNTIKPLKTFFVWIAILLLIPMGIFLSFLYFGAPKYISLWWSIKNQSNAEEGLSLLLFKELKQQQLEHDDDKHISDKHLESINIGSSLNMTVESTLPPSVTISSFSQPIPKIKHIPITLQPKSRIQTISFFSDYKDITFKLESYTAHIAPSHIRILKNMIEVIQYIQDHQENLFMEQAKSTLTLIQKHAKQIQLNIEEYLKYDTHQRMRYDRETARIPDFWLKQQLQDDLENLIKEIEFIYQNDLESFIDHKVFLKQRLELIQQDFVIQGKKSKDE